jgi:hypothetical protein
MSLIKQGFLFENLAVVLPVNACTQNFKMHCGLGEICWVNSFRVYGPMSLPEHIHISARIEDKETVDLSLCLINYAPRHEDVFSTSALDRDEWSASCRFTSGTHLLKFQLGPRGGLDAVE